MKFRFRLATFLITAVLLLIFYHEFIFNTGDFIFELDGDGLKNFYFASYYIHDAGAQFAQFRGMNYPFGENLNYLDAQPLVTEVFKFIQTNITEAGNGFLIFTYCLWLAGFIISALLILEIFFEYQLQNWYAVLFAVMITMLSPQLQRITFHAYLSHAFILPLIWLLYLKTKNSKSRLMSFVLNAVIILSGFLHPYYTPLACILIFLLIVFESGFTIKTKIINLLSFSILPLIIFSWLNKTGFEVKTDFVQLPYGAFGQAYRCRPEDVFFPPVKSSWNELINLKWIAHGGYEGESYIGIALTFVCIGFLIHMIYKSISKKSFSDFNPFKTKTALFFSAIIVLIFSAGTLHFILPESVKKSFPVFVTQFRTYGRMGWIVFYLLSVFLSLTFYNFLKNKSGIIKAIAALGFVMLMSFDIIDYNHRIEKQLMQRKIAMLDNASTKLSKNINTIKYQAIIALPYWHLLSGIAAERPPLEHELWHALNFSLRTGLPLTNHYSSRTSQKVATIQTSYFNFNNEVLKFYPNKKPVLLILSKTGKEKIENGLTEKQELFSREKILLQKATFLKQEGELLLYEIAFEKLF